MRVAIVVALVAILLVGAAASCSLTSLDGFSSGALGDGGATDGTISSEASLLDAAGGDGGDANANPYDPTCLGDHGPKMVRLTPEFCIDATEATNEEYAAFLADHGAAPNPQTAHSTCAFKTSHTPDAWPKPASAAKHPVAQVDWCDAWAYCSYAGKKLCGALGGGAVAYAGSDVTNPAIDGWFLACSANATRVYSFGTAFDPGACNGPGAGRDASVPVGSFPKCVGGYPGLFDMSGNIEEWEDSCSANVGKGDNCVDRGGAFVHFSGQPEVERLQCAYKDTFNRGTRSENLGFRCCSR